MRNFGLIGFPLSHSFSKKYFAEKFARENITGCAYELFSLDDINQLPSLLQAQQLEGLNITIPYKKLVLPFLTHFTEAVKEIQACNCISVRGKELYGHNTDVVGFEKTFVPHLQSHHTKALILGTGGAAAAVEYTLKNLGIDYLFVSRQKKEGAKFITYAKVGRRLLNEYTIIINSSPLGTFPAVEDFPNIPYRFLTPDHYLYDLVYNPPKTLFLQKGEEKGATIENGAQMLIIQAEESWKIWNEGR